MKLNAQNMYKNKPNDMNIFCLEMVIVDFSFKNK